MRYDILDWKKSFKINLKKALLQIKNRSLVLTKLVGTGITKYLSIIVNGIITLEPTTYGRP